MRLVPYVKAIVDRVDDTLNALGWYSISDMRQYYVLMFGVSIGYFWGK